MFISEFPKWMFSYLTRWRPITCRGLSRQRSAAGQKWSVFCSSSPCGGSDGHASPSSQPKLRGRVLTCIFTYAFVLFQEKKPRHTAGSWETLSFSPDRIFRTPRPGAMSQVSAFALHMDGLRSACSAGFMKQHNISEALTISPFETVM